MNTDTVTQRLAQIEPNWDEVVHRSDRLRRQHLRRTGTLAATLIVVALVATAPALGISSWLGDIVHGTSVPTDRLTARDVHGFAALADHSHPVALGQLTTVAARQQTLDRFGLTGIRMIGRQSGQAFYVIDLRGSGHCYATGRTDARQVFSSVTCPSGSNFPSPTLPIMDESVTGAASQTGSVRVLQLAGLAATGVSAVGVAGADGTVYAKTAVHGNIFVNDRVPSQANGPTVAYDAEDNVIWCSGPNPACRSVQTASSAENVKLLVRLYLDDNASSSDISKAIAAAKTEPGVASVKFISKQAALAIMKKRYPDLAENLKSNPFPDSIELRLASNGDAATIAANLRQKKLPGVQAVRYSRVPK